MQVGSSRDRKSAREESSYSRKTTHKLDEQVERELNLDG